MNTLTAEIFASGAWNGMVFTDEDLNDIAANFNKFAEVLKVPLKFGHNDEQPMTDGKPALGWVSKVWKDGTKLMAEFSDVPSKVTDAIKKKLYRKVSVELDGDVNYKGQDHKWVLSGVALLGADIPAVSVLADLDHYMMRRAAFSAGHRAVFSAIAGSLNFQKEDDMEKLNELTNQLADLSSKLAALTIEASTLKTANAGLESQVAEFKREKDARETEAKKVSLAAKRSQIDGLFNDAIKGAIITPAQKAAFSKVLRTEDDAALDALAIDDVKSLIGSNVKSSFARSTGFGQGSDTHADDESKSAAEVVVEKVNELITSGKAGSFAVAQQMVFQADPALARRYINANDKE